jgi:predicted nucleic acid-binding protein
MPAVLDASVTIPWFLQDERSPFTESILGVVGTEEFWVPAIWQLEFPNALLSAERKRRIDRQTRLEVLDFVSGLGLRVDPAPIEMRSISALAERHGLSVYDASYLDLAARQGIALITLDRALASAAGAAGIAVQSPGRGTTAQRRRRYNV